MREIDDPWLCLIYGIMRQAVYDAEHGWPDALVWLWWLFPEISTRLELEDISDTWKEIISEDTWFPTERS